jgi:RND family efflux transporter MFP subunit
MKIRCKLVILAVMFIPAQTLCMFPQCDLGLAQEAPGASSNTDGAQTSAVSSVIYPFRSATVGSEVRGILDTVNYKEGDSVTDGAVVAEVSKDRYTSIVGEFRSNYEAIVRTLDRAREQVATQEELYRGRAGTFDDVMKARAEVRILEARRDEAAFKLKQAELNLKACEVRSPFSGVISVLYHEPYEPVDTLEKIFGVVDTTKVYARAYWPEARLSEIALGKKVNFVYNGKVYTGVVEKVSNLIDPSSRTKRIHVLIDNHDGALQVGMSGALNPADQTRVSQSNHPSDTSMD